MINPLELIHDFKDTEDTHPPLGIAGKGWECVALSQGVVAGLEDYNVKFIKKGNELVLTKEELIAGFKIALQIGYFKKEDLFE